MQNEREYSNLEMVKEDTRNYYKASMSLCHQQYTEICTREALTAAVTKNDLRNQNQRTPLGNLYIDIVSGNSIIMLKEDQHHLKCSPASHLD